MLSRVTRKIRNLPLASAKFARVLSFSRASKQNEIRVSRRPDAPTTPPLPWPASPTTPLPKVSRRTSGTGSQYESPEVPELDAVPVVNDGSETQESLEYQAPGHSFLELTSKDGGTPLKGNSFGSRSEHDEVSATRDLLSISRSTVEQGTKRKRSLRELFGAGFLEDHDEATQNESPGVSDVQRSAVDPMCNFNWIGLRNRMRSQDRADENSELLADSDGTILADTQENPPGGQETDHSNLPVNCAGNLNWIGLRHRKRNYEGANEHSDLPTDSESTIIAETQENPTGGQETDQSKWPVNCAGNFNWIGLRNRKRNLEGAVEHSELLADSDSTIIAETQENPLGGQVSDCTKRLVACGGTSLTDIEESLLEDGIEHSNLPVNSHSKGLADAEKPKRNLWDLLGAGFLDDPDEANDFEAQLVLAIHRNAVQPLSKSNDVRLPHMKQIHEGAAGCSKLRVDCDVISSAGTQENRPGGQVTEQIRLLVSSGGTSLAETEEGFLEDVIKHSKLSADSHSAGSADIQKAGIDHGILDASYNGIGSAVTEERSGVDEANRCKPILNHKKAEETVAADGFIAVRTKVKPAEECRANKTPKSLRGRERATLQENHGILATRTARDRTRSPLSDRTNLSEVLAAPAPEISRKWKCPSKGKPYVAPPMKQLRLERWVHRLN